MNKLITSTAVPPRELKLEAIANISASFELLCLASGMEALGEMMESEDAHTVAINVALPTFLTVRNISCDIDWARRVLVYDAKISQPGRRGCPQSCWWRAAS